MERASLGSFKTLIKALGEHLVAGNQLPYLRSGDKNMGLMDFVKIKQDNECEPCFANVMELCKY